MAGYGRVLTMNFSSPDSEFLLDSLKLLGFSGFLFSETFKALGGGGCTTITKYLKSFQLALSMPFSGLNESHD